MICICRYEDRNGPEERENTEYLDKLSEKLFQKR